MISRWYVRGVLCFFVSLLPAHLLAQQVNFNDWTQEERDCAESIGAPLGPGVNYGSQNVGPKTLTWISDAVVRGSVVSIRSDIDGPYYTNVYVEVAAVLKGSEAAQTIVIKLRSGLTSL